MNRKYAFYIDESGMFRGIDTHVICPLVIENNAVGMEDLLALWSQMYPRGWTGFHATDMKKKGEGDKVIEIAEGLGNALFSKQGVRAVYAYHRSSKEYGFDFYPGMLFWLLKWQSQDILMRELSRFHEHANESLSIHVEIFIAERQLLNIFTLRNLLFKEITKQTQALALNNHLKPGQINFDFHPYYLPISNNPMMQVSDVFCHLVRAYLKSGKLGNKLDAFIQNFDHVELSVSEMTRERIKAHSENLCRQNVGEKILHKTTVKEIERIKNVPARPWFETLLDRLSEMEKKGETPVVHRFGDLIAKFKKAPINHRRVNFQLFLDHNLEVINEKRDYVLGAALLEILYALVEEERETAEMSVEFLDECELRSAELYITVNNHMGNFLPGDPRIRDAGAICENFKHDMSRWLAICAFRNHLAVSCQNVFRFEEAIESLFPTVRFYEQELKNPFTGAGARSYEIGALFGTYAQSLAFSAHCRFFTEGRAPLEELENAELYSMLSDEHFEKQQDRERQVIYRAHFKIQRYILGGDQDSLSEAGLLLKHGDDTQNAIREFKETFPDGRALIPAYRISVALKYAYLSQERPYWLKEISDLIMKNRGNVPDDHPMEQVLPYIIMLSKDPDEKRTLTGILQRMSFPRNIVGVIGNTLLLQVHYHTEKTVDDLILKKIDDCVTRAIRPQWEKYGLGRTLALYRKPVNRWHVGPMEVLPFNYA
ncbi:MAG: hypothetical protein B6I30_09915 [Desulfobacteraceae bacterium 4572_187]|nr:MAG: hypothetical protein B6I30_09915 [Desulfobacteraceae bacterium 4572_187]